MLGTVALAFFLFELRWNEIQLLVWPPVRWKFHPGDKHSSQR
jgi:hypothetical protein